MPSPLIVVDSLPAGFGDWLGTLEHRHLADLRFSEVSRALRALSSRYVESREQLDTRAFDGAGKRAAYALFYAPLHLLTVHAVLGRLPTAALAASDIVLDLGCGTGAGGCAWALHAPQPPRVIGLDANAWTLAEARDTYRHFGLPGSTRRGDLSSATWPVAKAVVAAYAINELSPAARAAVLPRLLDGHAHGVQILIVEPIATSIVPWWPEWRDAFESRGGRADEWRFKVRLPPLISRLDKAAGLRHDELKARSLFLPPSP